MYMWHGLFATCLATFWAKLRVTYKDDDKNYVDLLRGRFRSQINEGLKHSRNFSVIEAMSPSPDVSRAKKQKREMLTDSLKNS